MYLHSVQNERKRWGLHPHFRVFHPNRPTPVCERLYRMFSNLIRTLFTVLEG